MNPLNIRSGWWVFTTNRFVACYDTKDDKFKANLLTLLKETQKTN
jgi:hypothetical protein